MVEIYKDRHFEEIKEWYKKRGIDFHDKSILPKLGIIAPGLAAGFIYSTDSSICFIEGYVTNPSANKREANSALNLITMHLIKMASQNNFKYIKCETKFNGIKTKAKKFGFKVLGTTTSMIREI